MGSISVTEIILIIIGCLSVIVGFVMPAGIGEDRDELDPADTRKDVRDMVRFSVDAAKDDIQSRIEDTLEESLLKTERSMERITNEKMSAINDYADTVLNDIHKNHDEVMFMYDMLNDKHKNLTGLVSEVTKTAEEARRTVRDAELTAQEARDLTEEAMRSARGISDDAQREIVRPRTPAAPPRRPEVREEFSPLHAAFLHLSPEEENAHRVIRSEESAADEAPDRMEAQEVMEQVMAARKVVPITDAQRERDQKAPPLSQEKQAMILEMHRLGKSNVVIAREMGIGVGEVRLVIDLYNRSRKERRVL